MPWVGIERSNEEEGRASKEDGRKKRWTKNEVQEQRKHEQTSMRRH